MSHTVSKNSCTRTHGPSMCAELLSISLSKAKDPDSPQICIGVPQISWQKCHIAPQKPPFFSARSMRYKHFSRIKPTCLLAFPP